MTSSYYIIAIGKEVNFYIREPIKSRSRKKNLYEGNITNMCYTEVMFVMKRQESARKWWISMLWSRSGVSMCYTMKLWKSLRNRWVFMLRKRILLIGLYWQLLYAYKRLVVSNFLWMELECGRRMNLCEHDRDRIVNVFRNYCLWIWTWKTFDRWSSKLMKRINAFLSLLLLISNQGKRLHFGTFISFASL